MHDYRLVHLTSIWHKYETHAIRLAAILGNIIGKPHFII
jgi:hypothetical protein